MFIEITRLDGTKKFINIYQIIKAYRPDWDNDTLTILYPSTETVYTDYDMNRYEQVVYSEDFSGELANQIERILIQNSKWKITEKE